MVLDASAVVAMLNGEQYAQALSARVAEAPFLVIGAPTLFESAIVLTRRFRDETRYELERFLAVNRIQVIAFSAEHGQVAWQAFFRYGKGRHPAALNYGDCMSYAVSKVARLPLLFVGDDFRHTDVEAAL